MQFPDYAAEDEAPGTRFLLFPQSPFGEGTAELELVEISAPPGTIGPGPSGPRMYVVGPIGKTIPYGAVVPGPVGPGMYLPPWNGQRNAPAIPDEYGNFIHIAPDDPEFEAAHLFGSAHFTMDVWEGYFGRQIPWHFESDYDKLELSLLPGLDNAHIGWGFLETGGTTEHEDEYRPYSLNFDVVAHEIGHALIYSVIGLPSDDNASGEYYGFHESAADMVALLASLHFGSVVEALLEETHGNLYTYNRLNRFAETAQTAQIRMAANDKLLSEFAAGWTSEHALSEPLTGALFDILIDVFHERLLEHGLITPEIEDLSDQLEGSPEYSDVMQAVFDDRYARDPEGFRNALLEARDLMGSYLADAWDMLDADALSYSHVEEALLAVDRDISGGAYQQIIAGNFRVRDIGLTRVGPRLAEPDEGSHAVSVRTRVPHP
ncbi:hypothetical protein XM53_10265 [Roseovarius atlanticus]|uniref:Peptidase M4 C-terminal domain-containing protein n=1 Tax=Roseovarius atlanticus TaxID=1641875 RepID=A0A0T5NUG6_9RHOB|nr:hypothetical protein [Roseovarius atlanticus]KRS12476.1 hypothetical protein XM53_10265 [Roseovarius atlanticus]